MRPAEIREIKKQVWELLKPQLEDILNAFQKDLVGWQATIRRTSNVMNAVVRALIEKGLITEAELQKAGEDLLREAKMNVTTVQVATEEGRRVQKDEIIPSAMDKAIDAVEGRTKLN